MDYFEIMETLENLVVTNYDQKEKDVSVQKEYDAFLLETSQFLSDGDNDLKDYLRREKKILSLVKERQSKAKRKVAVGEKLFKLFSYNAVENITNPSASSYISKLIGKKIVLPMLQNIANDLLQRPDRLVNIDTFCSIFHLNQDDIRLDLEPHELRILKAVAKTSNVAAIVVRQEDKEYILNLMDLLKERHVGNKTWIKHRIHEGSTINIDATSLGMSTFIYEVNQLWSEHIANTEKEKYMQDPIMRSIIEYLMTTHFCDFTLKGKKINISSDAFQLCPKIKNIFKSYLGYKAVKIQENTSLLPAEKIALLAPFDSSLIKYNFNFSSEDVYFRNLVDIYWRIFLLLYDVWNTGKESLKYQKELYKSAKVFQTKKNISEKYLRVMSNSTFNRYFGYVEIDQDCELNSIREIENEFKALSELCFGNRVHKNVALRFRKLGRHRAAGLYFPTLLCLCVDIRYPYSMGHEYLHMIDYENGNEQLSLMYEFMKIREIYKQCLKQFVYSLPKEDPTRITLLGSTKYNLKYYLEPTEVFARCGEIYFTHLLKVDNSLMKPTLNFAYPLDDLLLDEIEKYYGQLFGR